MKAFDAGCNPRSAIVTVRRPPQARQCATGPTIARLSFPQLPGRGAALPQGIQMLLVAQGVHGLQEAPIPPGAYLRARDQFSHRFFFPPGGGAVDQSQSAGIENKNPAV